jgi:hypothetical protein
MADRAPFGIPSVKWLHGIAGGISGLFLVALLHSLWHPSGVVMWFNDNDTIGWTMIVTVAVAGGFVIGMSRGYRGGP